ncbi:MAG: peptidoglycan DD-metalloendopeptidase family protein [Clostridia bacterium]|nr:peptidoglycan DD-metalloendopeptidase family protein [Clostridia bacterium]
MLNKAQNLIKNNKVLTKVISLLLVIVLSFIVTFVSCGITLGLKVVYNGEAIGVVRSPEAFDKAVAYIEANTQHLKVGAAIEDASFALTFTLRDKFLSKNQLADAIAENTEEIANANILYVNDKPIVFTDLQNVEELIEKSRCRYYIDGAENDAEFIDAVRLEKVFAYTNRVDNDEQVKEIIQNLNVKTVSKVSFESPIAFSTKTVSTGAQYIGYSKITTPGKQGLASKTELVETVNGNESSREVLKNEVLVQPVTQVVLKGTAINMASATEKAQAQSAGLILPLNTYVYISAYWGDGRNHKGIDFAGRRGTAIFAAKSGVVTCAGYRGNYGYLVEIDHGNGLVTRYAHCDALCVRVGQNVRQGQQIATMGNTGRSTGDHLHFEVLKNGTQVNPAPYIFK